MNPLIDSFQISEAQSKTEAALFDNSLLSSEELASILKVHKATITRMVLRKEIPYYKAGRAYRFILSEVLESIRRKNIEYTQNKKR